MNLNKEQICATINGIFIGLALILIAVLGFNTYTIVKELEAEIKTLEKRDIEINKKLYSIEKYLDELEASDSLDKQDIYSMWESLAIIRQNFLAIGRGYNLTEEDFCPPNICKPEGG